MLQTINISQARSQLSSLIKQVVATRKPVVIAKDGLPSVVIYPHEDQPGPALKSYQKNLLTIKDDWFSPSDHQKPRAQVEERVSHNG